MRGGAWIFGGLSERGVVWNGAKLVCLVGVRGKFQKDLYGMTLDRLPGHVYRGRRLERLGSQTLGLLALQGYQEMEILVCQPFLETETYFCQIQTASSLEAAVCFWNMATNILLGLL